MKTKVTGLMVYYYYVCKRKLWYFSNDITMEQYNEDVAIGKVIDEGSYTRADKHLNIDGTICIDFLHRSNVIHEVKKSKSVEEASIWQVKYYLYYLQNRGSNVEKAILDYPLIKQRKEIILSDEDREVLKRVEREIVAIINNDEIPSLVNNSICKKCAYYALCYV